MDQGRRAAFAGALDRPPTSSWEIINPREYERQHSPAIPRLPNIHPLVDALYQPYDIGQIGQLDVHILTELYGGENAARDLTPAWNGGIYWAGQLRAATPAEQASTKSLGLFYLSVWKNADSAETFAKLYGRNLVRKYAHVHRDEAASDATEQIYSTDEGPVLIAVRDQRVFVAESFSLSLARQLAARLFDAQGSGESRMAARSTDGSFAPYGSLTSGLIDFFGHCGVFKAAVDPAVRAARNLRRVMIEIREAAGARQTRIDDGADAQQQNRRAVAPRRGAPPIRQAKRADPQAQRRCQERSRRRRESQS
jgi:hypothetical protein